VRGGAEHRVAPAVEGVGDAEPPQAAREQVRVARHEARRDEGARDVEGLAAVVPTGGGRAERGDAPVVADQHPAVLDVARVVRAGRNGDETGVVTRSDMHAR
jgi:hypothetical protein